MHPIKDHVGVSPACDALGSEFKPRHVLAGVHLVKPVYLRTEESGVGVSYSGAAHHLSPPPPIALAPSGFSFRMSQ